MTPYFLASFVLLVPNQDKAGRLLAQLHIPPEQNLNSCMTPHPEELSTSHSFEGPFPYMGLDALFARQYLSLFFLALESKNMHKRYRIFSKGHLVVVRPRIKEPYATTTSFVLIKNSDFDELRTQGSTIRWNNDIVVSKGWARGCDPKTGLSFEQLPEQGMTCWNKEGTQECNDLQPLLARGGL